MQCESSNESKVLFKFFERKYFCTIKNVSIFLPVNMNCDEINTNI